MINYISYILGIAKYFDFMYIDYQIFAWKRMSSFWKYFLMHADYICSISLPSKLLSSDLSEIIIYNVDVGKGEILQLVIFQTWLDW